jgi:hypothetical protein
MKYIKRFQNIDKEILISESVYNTLANKIGRDEFDKINDEFDEIRHRYLMYLLRGDSNRNAVENAYFDVFEGNDDYEFNPTEDIYNFLELLLPFSSPYEFQLISNEVHKLIS